MKVAFYYLSMNIILPFEPRHPLTLSLILSFFSGLGCARSLIDSAGVYVGAADGPLEAETVGFLEFALPAALDLFRQCIKAPGDIFCSLRGVRRVAENVGSEHARDRRLLDHLAVVPAMQPIEHVADCPRLL